MPYELLIKEFYKIKEKGFIKAVGNGSFAIGRTFEHELGINENNLPYPDYYGIEIKCFSKKNDDYITLFSVEPDSKEGNVIMKMTEKYGYNDKKFRQTKILNTFVNGKNNRYISLEYKGMLYLDIRNKNLILLISDKYDYIIDSSVKWSFEKIKEKFYNKCRYIAIVDAEKRKINNNMYIKYNDIKIYEFKGIVDFFKALENGIAEISFKITVHKKGEKIGKRHNHGTSFRIQYKKIENIYKRII